MCLGYSSYAIFGVLMEGRMDSTAFDKIWLEK